MNILLRTCGGLGNQLFQSFFALLIAEKFKCFKIYHFHSVNYERYAPWEAEFISVVPASFFYKIILRFRLPKILFRLKISKKEYIKIGPFIIIDGYFLNPEQYYDFNRIHISNVLNKLASIIDLNGKRNKNKLIHLRLGDFFNSENEELNYLDSILKEVEGNVDVISNREMLIKEYLNKKKLTNVNIIPSSNYKAFDLLKLASKYQVVQYNGSTLIFWSCLLSGAELSFNQRKIPNNYIKQNCEALESLMFFFRNKLIDIN